MVLNILGFILWNSEWTSVWFIKPQQTKSTSECTRNTSGGYIQDFSADTRRGECMNW
jgi:hypothetical protein